MSKSIRVYRSMLMPASVAESVAALAITVGLLLSCSAGRRTPIPDGADSLRAALDARIPSVVEEGDGPSMQVAVVYKDRVLWSRAFGFGVDVHRAFMNASVQKFFTSTAVLRLAERGVVDLDADVSRYLPFPVRHPGYPDEPITLRMLLSHRSGMGVLPHQGEWDTQCSLAPEFMQDCSFDVVDLSMEEFFRERLAPDGQTPTGDPGLLSQGRDTGIPCPRSL